MIVISAHEMVQAVSNSVNLVQGRKLIMWESYHAMRAAGMDHCPGGAVLEVYSTAFPPLPTPITA